VHRFALAVVVLAACKKGDDRAATPPAAASSDGGAALVDAAAAPTPAGPVTLPPAPPVPQPAAGLPPLPTDHVVTANEVALGALLFHDARLSAGGATSCATCHDPHNGYSGKEPRSPTAAGKPNLRRTPTLVNLAWQRELGWDGRGADRPAFLDAHTAGQLGQPIDVGIGRLLGSATYRAHFDRSSGGRDRIATATAALWAFASTRYSGAAPWDRYESGDAGAVPAEAIAGYQLFNGKAQCSTCHTPTLYADLAYHRLGLIASPDEGRGRLDPSQANAFKTPTLRGAAERRPLFHDGSAATLDDAIAWHLAGGRGQGADPSVIDPALPVITLTPEERSALGAFVRALTPAPDAAAVTPPALPDDVPGAVP
jgi:cytochrome c peroxidase